jgi:hypothetical protein
MFKCLFQVESKSKACQGKTKVRELAKVNESATFIQTKQKGIWKSKGWHIKILNKYIPTLEMFKIGFEKSNIFQSICCKSFGMNN